MIVETATRFEEEKQTELIRATVMINMNNRVAQCFYVFVVVTTNVEYWEEAAAETAPSISLIISRCKDVGA